MPNLLLQAMDAKQSGNIALTKQLLAQALIQDPRNEGAWMLMYEVVDDIKLKRNCLERVLAINPDNTTATIALMKLDTSPLGPVLRGERYKPVIPAQPEKAAPFTPPFTWTGDESQFQALGDLTFPDLTGEKVDQPPEMPTSFDWASDSGEPDKTINKIFDAVSKPELASEPLPNNDMSWLDNIRPKEPEEESPAEVTQVEAALPIQSAESQTETSAEAPELEKGDFSVSPIPEWGMNAFAYSDQAALSPAEPEPLIWDNPAARTDRLIILGNTSIIYANPSPGDLPHIMGLFNEKKMMRDLLGENAGVVKLESIHRLSAIPKRANLVINYLQNDKNTSHQLIFANRQARDEALSALQLRLGADFVRGTRSFSFFDKILSPLGFILLVAALGWLFIAGLPQFEVLPAFQSGTLQSILSSLQSFVDLVGSVNLLVIAAILVVLCLIWMVINLSKPSQQVIVQRIKSKQK